MVEQRAASEMELDTRARAARRRGRADRAHQGDHRAQDDSRAVPRARRHLGRAPGPVPERRHAAHDAAGRRRRGLRRLRGRAAGRRDAARGRRRRRSSPPATRRRSPRTIVAIDARVDPADAQRDGARAHRGRAIGAAPGASVRVQVPVGAPRSAVVDPGERAAQRAGRRSRVRRSRRTRTARRARTCAPVQVEALARRRSRDRDGPRGRRAGRRVRVVQAARGGAGRARRCAGQRRAQPASG